MRWYHYLAYFFGGIFLANALPHLGNGISGHAFQSPFASPPGVGESSPLVNALWGFANLVGGIVLLWFFRPQGSGVVVGWVAVGLGALLTAVQLSTYFGKVRSARAG